MAKEEGGDRGERRGENRFYGKWDKATNIHSAKPDEAERRFQYKDTTEGQGYPGHMLGARSAYSEIDS